MSSFRCASTIRCTHAELTLMVCRDSGRLMCILHADVDENDEIYVAFPGEVRCGSGGVMQLRKRLSVFRCDDDSTFS